MGACSLPVLTAPLLLLMQWHEVVHARWLPLSRYLPAFSFFLQRSSL
jgi:hypothetical protein